MIWMALVAASISMKRHEHVGVGFILERLPMPIGRAVKILTDLAVAFFLVVLTYQGWIMALDARVQVSPALGIPMFWPLLSVPISGFFMLVQLVLRMAANLMHRETSGL
jgi:TRAP-type C4-dicarboxylate transport system permease small subunit